MFCLDLSKSLSNNVIKFLDISIRSASFDESALSINLQWSPNTWSQKRCSKSIVFSESVEMYKISPPYLFIYIYTIMRSIIQCIKKPSKIILESILAKYLY
jgi:hypothetical protein